ncbi:MAG TPA: glutaminyl-peptide cyclotransferase [Candidatus Sulfopaludibacter sp.]|jgi:glutaminyl-peptide cyclotransferase|nr:glutaminyl-peptide cyclotransferase [Candidatus Sulfopaludibacter sp.]
MRALLAALALAACACGPSVEADTIPEYTYRVVHTYPHDRSAFTEGLFYLDGFLYEGTGMPGASDIRKVKLETGEVVQRQNLDDYFGEGIIAWKDRLLEMTWQTEIGFIYDLKTFARKGEFHYPGQGWSFTTDGKRLYMDDGTPDIRIWDPDTLQETGRIHVTEDGKPINKSLNWCSDPDSRCLNEMEWVKGEIYANIWMTEKIVRINPGTGKVVGWIDCTGLLTPQDRITEGPQETDVMNGIAYDAQGDRLFVTGKRWPKLFEIKLVKKTGAQ